MITVVSLEWSGDAHDLLVLHLSDGSRKVFPKERLEIVASASARDAANVEIIAGEYLHWPTLDFDLYLPPLLNEITGSAKWMSLLGRQGGLAPWPSSGA